jgi:transcriptional regulator with XRE-family HTH domain
VPIIAARLRACRQSRRLSVRELAGLTQGVVLPQTIGKIERRGERTSYGRAVALARALTPPGGDSNYLLWWLVNPRAALVGDLAPPGEQYAAWCDRCATRRGVVEVLSAQVRAGRAVPPVKLRDGSEFRVVLVKGNRRSRTAGGRPRPS